MRAARSPRPLMDAQRTFFYFLVLLFAPGWLLNLVALIFNYDVFVRMGGFQLLVFLVLNNLTFLWLVYPGGKPSAVWLRAFRSDAQTAKLRRQFEAVMGNRFRLVGIRPPKKRRSMWLQALLANFSGLSYAGSKYFEMEVGDDWLIRLAKSMEECKVAFLDLRDWTEALAQEVAVASVALGPQRIIFLIDDRQPKAKWLQLVHQHSRGIDHQHAAFLSTDASETKIVSELRAILGKLPGPPGERSEAIILARQLSPSDAETRPDWPMSAPIRIAIYFAAQVAVFLIVIVAVIFHLYFDTWWSKWPLWVVNAGVGIGFLVFLGGAFLRVLRRAFVAQLYSADPIYRIWFKPVGLLASTVGMVLAYHAYSPHGFDVYQDPQLEAYLNQEPAKGSR